jgi:hypothetical protein
MCMGSCVLVMDGTGCNHVCQMTAHTMLTFPPFLPEQEQFEIVAARTSNDYTFVMGSHVMVYGNLKAMAEHTGDYFGENGLGC